MLVATKTYQCRNDKLSCCTIHFFCLLGSGLNAMFSAGSPPKVYLLAWCGAMWHASLLQRIHLPSEPPLKNKTQTGWTTFGNHQQQNLANQAWKHPKQLMTFRRMHLLQPMAASDFFSCSIEGGVIENDDVAGALVPAKTWVVSFLGNKKTNRGVKKCRGRTNRRKIPISQNLVVFSTPLRIFWKLFFFDMWESQQNKMASSMGCKNV